MRCAVKGCYFNDGGVCVVGDPCEIHRPDKEGE